MKLKRADYTESDRYKDNLGSPPVVPVLVCGPSTLWMGIRFGILEKWSAE